MGTLPSEKLSNVEFSFEVVHSNYFYSEILHHHEFYVPKNKKVLFIGPQAKFLSSNLQPDHSEVFNSDPKFLPNDYKAKFDYVVVPGVLSLVDDIQTSLEGILSACHEKSRVIISTYNAFWEPVLRAAVKLGLRRETPYHNWLSVYDLENLFSLAGFEVISHSEKLLVPENIPVLSWLANRILVQIPVIRSLALLDYFVLRPKPTKSPNQRSVSVVIPARNEAGNIESAILRMPKFGSSLEILFVEGNSTDNTWDEIQRVKDAHKDWDIKILKQPGKGKGDAVRKGFSEASGDVLMILDADLTVPPEELPKFYNALISGSGDFINGTRLVYPMEKQAMRFLNLLGNKFFASAFSWLLSQKFKDTLCGTKVLFRSDYEQIAAQRNYFGDFDPFGDFDLLFGAAKQNLKIVEIPIRYRQRTYGETNISRFRHGWLLLKMCFYAARKFKLS